jgi:hypothetical protein
MSTPHKHAEVIKAWADGKVTQVKASCGWLDLSPSDYHAWTSAEYRVKPETIRYRVALMRHKGGTPFTNSADTEEQVVGWTCSPSFIRRLTDWVEVEV